MNDNSQEIYQNQIYQSFSKYNIEECPKIKTSSSKKENTEFTFKKAIPQSNRSKGTETEVETEIEIEKENNIYSKNDENIKQSAYFFNEIKKESKYKKLLNNEKEKHNIIKPLFNFNDKKKIQIQNYKINKINKKILLKTIESLNKKRMNSIGFNYLKRNIKLNHINSNSNSNSNINSNINVNSLNNINNINFMNNNINNDKNINNLNSNNKLIINFLTQATMNTFLEISHESQCENNDNKIENININCNKNNNKNINLINKENINNGNINININEYKINYDKNKIIHNNIYNNVIINKSAEKKNENKTRNKPKSKNEKYEKNISIDILKNEYKELKQKIFENKVKNQIYNTNRGFTNYKYKKFTEKNSSISIQRLNKYNPGNFSFVSYFSNKIKQKKIKNAKFNKIHFLNKSSINKDNDFLNTHKRFKSIAYNFYT